MERPVLLMVFDGFGLNPSRAHNGWALARTPHLDHYFACNPHTALQASGRAVGLPDGQFGNSEAGHLTMGAGRVLMQDLLRIVNAIRAGRFEESAPWQQMVSGAKRLHLVGMLSDGGVHSHIAYLLALLPYLASAQIEPVLHLITDGRDTPPRSALGFLAQLRDALDSLGRGYVATLSGRYYAMDRAGHWDRTDRAWKAILLGQGLRAESPQAAIDASYARGEGDEFLQPTVVTEQGRPLIRSDEPVLFFNYRSDRARQLAAAIGLADFTGFDRGTAGPRRLTCMTRYDPTFPFPVLFGPEAPSKVLAEVVSDAGLAQFHCAEQEKYAHVTYFFNGGREAPYPGEERAILPSASVATYDLKPEMSAPEVADRVLVAIARRYPFILVNFANADMVGHTAVPHAILRAVETLDLQSHRVIQAAMSQGYYVLLTADHGNCDEMVDPATGQPDTHHTPYPVPFLLLGDPGLKLGIGRSLADVAPTVLELMGLAQPPEMTGKSLIIQKRLEI